MNYICPVCGYDELDQKPYDEKKRGNFQICPCCGFQYGVDDDDKRISFDNYREKWIREGNSWFDKEKRPKDWNLDKQLKNIYS